MSEFSALPDSISHKQLNSLLKEVRKSNPAINQCNEESSEEKKKFDQDLSNWKDLSQLLVKELKQKRSYIKEGKTENSLMALGAFEAHLVMALQALRVSDSGSNDN